MRQNRHRIIIEAKQAQDYHHEAKQVQDYHHGAKQAQDYNHGATPTGYHGATQAKIIIMRQRRPVITGQNRHRTQDYNHGAIKRHNIIIMGQKPTQKYNHGRCVSREVQTALQWTA